MTSLTHDQKDLVFAHSLGMSEGPELLEAEALIDDNTQAAHLNAVFRRAILPLSFMPPEYCPDELAELTLERLRTLAATQRRAPSSPRTIRLSFGRRLSNGVGVAVVAACILLVVAVFVPSSNMMRQRYYSQLCQGGLGRLFQAIAQYSSDHDGFLPAVARADGAPWHAIGAAGPESGSNTRGPYLLLSSHYTDRPADFLCCGKTRNGAAPLTPDDIARYRDFPSRDHITYSYRLIPAGGLKLAALGARPLMADMNPHFEHLAETANGTLGHRIDGASLSLNSVNHGRRGQNVLFGDGDARYSRTRFVGPAKDDIYTMGRGDIGDCCRLPLSLNDALLAP